MHFTKEKGEEILIRIFVEYDEKSREIMLSHDLILKKM